MCAFLTTLKTRWGVLAVALALSAAIMVASPGSAFATGGSDQGCSQRGGHDQQTNVLSCVIGDVTVNVETGDVLSDNDVSVIHDVIVKDIDICNATGLGNNACAVYILNDVYVKATTLLGVIVKSISVTVGDVTVQKIWIL